MRCLGGLVFLACAAAFAVPAQEQHAGLEAEWDIRVVVTEIGAHAGRLIPAIDQLGAASWAAKGASETYAEQAESSRQQAQAIETGSKAVARSPETLSGALELFFRVEGLENMIGSLVEGARRYSGQEAAQNLASLSAENGANRERLRRYIVNLAAERERQFEVMDREAQRCRDMVAAQPAPPRGSGRKK